MAASKRDQISNILKNLRNEKRERGGKSDTTQKLYKLYKDIKYYNDDKKHFSEKLQGEQVINQLLVGNQSWLIETLDELNKTDARNLETRLKIQKKNQMKTSLRTVSVR